MDNWRLAYQRLESAQVTVHEVQPLCATAAEALRRDLHEAGVIIDRVRWSLGRHIRRAREGHAVDRDDGHD